MQEILLDKDDLTIEDVVAVARHDALVGISQEAEERIRQTRAMITKWVHENKVIYGITTGFGAMCNVFISEEDTRKLQENVMMSHASGVGDPLPGEIVRAIMAIRIHDLSMGYY